MRKEEGVRTCVPTVLRPEKAARLLARPHAKSPSRASRLALTSLFFLLPLFSFLSACASPAEDGPDLLQASWPEIEAAADGQTVNVAMWQGDPFINAYMRDYVAPRAKAELGVDIQLIALQGNQIVSALITELEAGVAESAYDLLWINGETFFQLREIDALWGPWLDRVPNAAFIDTDNPFIGIDFQQPVDGYEMPWGNVQLALVYDAGRVQNPPPRSLDEIETWAAANPGRFTFDSEFTGMTFLKSLLADVAGGRDALNGPFDPALYDRASTKLWRRLNAMKPDFWQRGETFPQDVARMHQLFAAGEIDFTMSVNDGEVDNKVLQGLFPESARAYVLDTGTIQNSHYWGIPARAPHKAGALALANLLASPAAQYRKMQPAVWGDGTVLDIDRLPAAWQDSFASVPGRRFAPPRAEISRVAIQEPAPEYMIRLYDDFRSQVLEAR